MIKGSYIRLISRLDRTLLGRWWWSIDHTLLFILLILFAIGALMIFSFSPPVAERLNIGSFYFVKRQIFFWLPLSLLGVFFVSCLTLNQMRRFFTILFLGSFFLVVVTNVVGQDIKGASRWIFLGGMSLQPSEFLKPSFAVVSAWILSAQYEEEDIPSVLIVFLLFVVGASFLLLQPDLGMMLILLMIWMSQMFVFGLKWRNVMLLVVLGFLFIFVAFLKFPHVQDRMNRFFNPQEEDNYQIRISLQAVKEGGLLGVGLGEGRFKYQLPDAHTDFVFAVIAEEFGLLMCVFILFLYLILILRSLFLVYQFSKSPFVLLATVGLVVQLASQIFVNIASTLSLIPTKGMTLALISYGGSSLLSMGLLLGALLVLTRRDYFEGYKREWLK